MSSSNKTKVLEYNAIFAPEEEGGYSVCVPDLPGCHSQGETFEEAKANIQEAIELYLEDADEELYHVAPERARKEFMAPVSVRVSE
ncbi:MAG: type II toxin-antitoxin system HicB family antitoxin [Anaerolineales bacterium]